MVSHEKGVNNQLKKQYCCPALDAKDDEMLFS